MTLIDDLTKLVRENAMILSRVIDESAMLQDLIALNRLPSDEDVFILLGVHSKGFKDDNARRRDLVVRVREAAEEYDDYVDEDALVSCLAAVKKWHPAEEEMLDLLDKHSMGLEEEKAHHKELTAVVREVAKHYHDYIDENAFVKELITIKKWRLTLQHKGRLHCMYFKKLTKLEKLLVANNWILTNKEKIAVVCLMPKHSRGLQRLKKLAGFVHAAAETYDYYVYEDSVVNDLAAAGIWFPTGEQIKILLNKHTKGYRRDTIVHKVEAVYSKAFVCKIKMDELCRALLYPVC